MMISLACKINSNGGCNLSFDIVDLIKYIKHDVLHPETLVYIIY